jgi:Polyketide cyclase / dehydrase and lipid transport
MGQVIDVTARSAASPAEVFALLADGAGWTRWGRWVGAAVDEPAADGGDGVGAVRALTSRTAGRTIVSRERVTDLVPDRLYGYDLLSGLPLRNYHGQVELTPDGAGTRIHWVCRFDRATPGLTWLYRGVLGRFVADAAQRLARYAAQERAGA